MLHSNSPKVMRYWAKRSIGNIQKQIALNDYTGCFNEGYNNPQNALFHITQDLILTYDERWAEENAMICLYHFTNYIQGPELNIYDLPAPVFRFLANVQAHPRRKDWLSIVRRSYYFIKKGQEIGFSISGKTEGDYKNSKNRVYQSLLNGDSILPRFLNTHTRRAYGDYSLLTLYLREVLAMDQKRIETVKRVADEIAAFIQQSPDGKKRLRSLEESVRFRDFCNALRRISKARIKNLHPQGPLFSLDEFAEQLFPDGALTFGETRYLILFRLYEQLHNWLLAENLTEDEVDDSVTEVGDDINPAIEE
jgi:CRISPR-associated protein Cst1